MVAKAAAAAAAAAAAGNTTTAVGVDSGAVGERDIITVVDGGRMETVDEARGVGLRETVREAAGTARRRRRHEGRRVIWKI